MSQLDVLCKAINKKYDNIISNGILNKKVDRIKFSSPFINYMTFGGIPRGAIIEFAGETGGGKTTTALDIVSNAQKLFVEEAKENEQLKKVVYVDCENTLDEEWARKLGVDVDNMLILQPFKQTAEQIFQMVIEIIETGEVGLVVIDSLAVMVSQQAYDKTMEENTYGGISKPLTLFGAKVIPLLTKYNCTLLAINQVRDDMAGFGRIVIPGGKAWGHDCSLRLVFKKGDYIDENCNSIKRNSTSPAGNLVNIAILKTKICPPTRLNGYYTLKYDTGIDIINDTIELACYYDIIQKGGAWYSIIDTETGEIMRDYDVDDPEKEQGESAFDLKFQGKPSLIEYLKENKKIFNLIYNQVMKKLEE